MSERGAVPRGDAGAALIMAFGILLIVVLLASAAVVFIDFQAGFSDKLIKNTQDYYLAEAGYVRAMKTVFDARSKGEAPPPKVEFTETIGGIKKSITVDITKTSGTDLSTDRYDVESSVK